MAFQHPHLTFPLDFVYKLTLESQSKFCFGLPGSLAPVGDFDPLGFAANADLGTIKKYREAELQHGRVGKFLNTLLCFCND